MGVGNIGAVGSSHLNPNLGISNSFNMSLRAHLRSRYPSTINEITKMMNSIPAGTFDKGIRLIKSKTGSMLPGSAGYMKIISSEAEKFARAIEQNNGTFPRTGPLIDELEAVVKRLGGKAAKAESLVGKVAAGAGGSASQIAERARELVERSAGRVAANAKSLAEVGPRIFGFVGRFARVGGLTFGFAGNIDMVKGTFAFAKFQSESWAERYNDLTQNRDEWKRYINNYDEILKEVTKHLDLV